MSHFGGVDNVDSLPAQVHESVDFEALEQSRHHFPRGAEFVGNLLMGQVKRLTVAQQSPGQALVEALKGHRLDQLHQFSQAVSECAEQKVANGPTVSSVANAVGAGDDNERIGQGRASRIHRSRAEQATGRHDANFPGADPVQRELSTIR